MTNIHTLLQEIVNQENTLLTREFLAPCVCGGRVQTCVTGLVYTFRSQPSDFQGWGIFQPLGTKTAKLSETASLPQIEAYLQQFEAFRFLLVRSLQNQTWLAFPGNLGDLQQRLGWAKPVPVHLVSEGATFEPITARWDGRSFWFEGCDRRADPYPIDALREALQQRVLPDALNFKGLTPEMRAAYELATQNLDGFSSTARDERRLKAALKSGGGELQHFTDREDYWQVEWTAADGQRHASAISKADLTVMSAGICLSGRDRDFDLQSLVGVVEAQEEDWD